MRGIEHTLSRLPAARALIAGAALLAGAIVSAAHARPTDTGNGDESAMALPRNAARGGGVALPQPLAPSDAVLVRSIFRSQERGLLPDAMRAIPQPENPLLLGHIQAQRYLGRF